MAWLVAAVWIVAGLTWLVLTVAEHRHRAAQHRLDVESRRACVERVARREVQR